MFFSPVSRAISFLRPHLDKNLPRQVLDYGFSVIGTMGTNFLVVLVLAWRLPPEIFASYVLAKVSLVVVASLMSLGISQAMVRWSGEKDRTEPLLPTALFGAVFLAMPGTVILAVVFSVLGARVGIDLEPSMFTAMFGALLVYMVATEVLNWMRANHFSQEYAYQSVLRAGLQVGCIIFWMDCLRSPTGYIYGLFMADSIFLIFAAARWREIWRERSFKPDVSLFLRFISYGAPHATIMALGFLLNFTDRFMLSYLTHDQRIVAYYDVAYMIVASSLALLVRPFNLFLFPAYIRRHNEGGAKASIELIENSMNIFLVAAFFVAIFIIAVRIPVLRFLFPIGYQTGSSIFAPVSIGILFNGLFIAVAAGLYLSDRTWRAGVVTAIALLVNIIANFLLIPRFGMDGAAFGTLLAYLAQLFLSYFVARQTLKVRLPIGALVIGSALCFLVQYLTASFHFY